MMTTHPDPLAAAWLDRVSALAAPLPAAERAELLADLREHLDVALSSHPTPDEVRTVLGRLGDPAVVVAAAVEDGGHRNAVASPPPPPVSVRADGTTTAEKLTLAALLVSGLVVILWPLALLLWIAGLVTLLVATRWRGAEVGVAVLLPVAAAAIGLSPALLLVTATTCESVAGGPEVCSGGSPFAGAVSLVIGLGVVVGIVVGVRWLARRVDGRPRR